MTDIVERLREGIFGSTVAKTDNVLHAYMQEAAAEITRLRAALAKAQRVPPGWLFQAAKLINELAYEGITMDDCDEPEWLMVQLALSLGCEDADDPWEAALAMLAVQAKEKG